MGRPKLTLAQKRDKKSARQQRWRLRKRAREAAEAAAAAGEGEAAGPDQGDGPPDDRTSDEDAEVSVLDSDDEVGGGFFSGYATPADNSDDAAGEPCN